jgi:hypothetical protein
MIYLFTICSSSDGAMDMSQYSPCQEFDLMFGMIFYNVEDSLSAILDFLYETDMLSLNRLAYNISVDSVIAGNVFADDAERAAAYSFCNVSFGPCSVLVFDNFDGAFRDVSPYNYRVRRPLSLILRV